MPTTPAELASHDCVAFEGVSGALWRFTQGKSERSVAVRARLVVNTAEAAIDAAIAGLGVTRVLSYQAADALRAGKLALALTEFEPEPSPVHLVHAGGRMLPQKLRAFRDFAAPRIRARLAEIAV
jgi:DNA-binding transcriptional LysR family regulator